MYTLEQQLACAKRELSMREKVYPRWIGDERMTESEATHEIECMQAIVATLQRLVDAEGAQPSLFRSVE